MFRSNLAQVMERKGVSIRVLADECGLSKETISRARDERIQHCTLETLAAIAGALGVKVKNLFEEA